MSIDSIFEKEQEYLRQLAPVRAMVLRFAEQMGWGPQNRGRKAHVSIFGPVNGLIGLIDIEIARLDWDDMPETLTPNYPFTLWCSAAQTRDGVRLFCKRELYWQVRFAELPKYVIGFLQCAWQMLLELNEHDLSPDSPGPSTNPDFPPNFGPPRVKKKL